MAYLLLHANIAGDSDLRMSDSLAFCLATPVTLTFEQHGGESIMSHGLGVCLQRRRLYNININILCNWRRLAATHIDRYLTTAIYPY